MLGGIRIFLGDKNKNKNENKNICLGTWLPCSGLRSSRGQSSHDLKVFLGGQLQNGLPRSIYTEFGVREGLDN